MVANPDITPFSSSVRIGGYPDITLFEVTSGLGGLSADC
jgi:hypothetical protein